MTLDPSNTRELTVETHITEADVIDFRAYHLAHSRTIRRTVWISISVILLLWCGVLALMIFSESKPLEAAIAMWPLLCGPPLFLAIFFPLKKWRTKRLSKRLLRDGQNRTMFGKMKMTLSAQGVSEVGEFSNTFVQWQAVEKVIATASWVYIYVSTASAVIVPRRSFQSEADFIQFGAVARENFAACAKIHGSLAAKQ